MKTYVKAITARGMGELEDLLLNKEVWVALIGVIVAIAKWQAWDIPNDVFLTIEALIIVIIMALKGK